MVNNSFLWIILNNLPIPDILSLWTGKLQKKNVISLDPTRSNAETFHDVVNTVRLHKET